MTIFMVALLGAVATGLLQLHAEEVQLMRNHVALVETQAIAEAGLHQALALLRYHPEWTAGIDWTDFAGGRYSVSRNGSELIARGQNAQGFETPVCAWVSIASAGPPYAIQIDALRINE